MDAARFDRLARSLGTGSSRRRLLSRLTAAALGVGGVNHFPELVTAKKGKKKAKKKKLKFNEFGCVNVGGKCQGNSANCCSGICEGKKPKKGKKDKSRCVAHDASTCQAGVHPAICGSTNQSCLTSFGNGGSCATTTGNAGYCFNSDPLDDPPCTRDPDCEAVAGPGAACIVCPSTGIPNCVGILDF